MLLLCDMWEVSFQLEAASDATRNFRMVINKGGMAPVPPCEEMVDTYPAKSRCHRSTEWENSPAKVLARTLGHSL